MPLTNDLGRLIRQFNSLGMPLCMLAVSKKPNRCLPPCESDLLSAVGPAGNSRPDRNPISYLLIVVLHLGN